MIPALNGPWFLCGALALAAVALWRAPRPTYREVGLIAVIVVTAAIARFVCGLWGPLHVNGQGPLWIRGALDADTLAGYGPGYFELFTYVTRVGAAPDVAVFAANAVLSAFSPALLYTVARLSGVERGGALAAALVLGADPVILRTAATEGYFASLIALVLGVQACLALALWSGQRGDRTAAGAALAAAGLLAAAAARIHPMGYLPLALCPLVTFGATQSGGGGKRIVRALAAAAAIGGAVVLTSGETIITALRTSEMTGSAFASLSGRDWRFLAAALVVVCVIHRWVNPPWLPLLAIASLALMLATQDAFRQQPLWMLSYQRLFLPGVLLGAAPLLLHRMQGPLWVGVASLAAALALFVPAEPHLGALTTEQQEYRFLRDVLRGMPPDCTLAAVSRAGRRLWEIPSYLVPRREHLGSGSRRALERPEDLTAALNSDVCLLYVHSSLCNSQEARGLCESVEREARLEAVASGTFAATPSYSGAPYDRPEVKVVVYRVATSKQAGKASTPVVSDGAAITPELAQRLYDRLALLHASDGCRVVRLDTSRFRMTVGLEKSTGTQYSLELATAAGGSTGRRAGRWTIAVSREVEKDCGTTLAAVARVLEDM